MNKLKTVLFPDNKVRISTEYTKERRSANNVYKLLDDKAQVYLNQAASEKRGQLRRQHKKSFTPLPLKLIISAISLKDILRDHCSLFRPFYDFAKKTHSEENLDFVLVTAAWRKKFPQQTRDVNSIAARNIHQKYISSSSPNSINIDHDIVVQLNSLVQSDNINIDMWSEAQSACLRILETDAVGKFVADQLFSEWRDRELKRRESLLEKKKLPPWQAITRAVKEGVGVDGLKHLISQGASASDEEEETLFSALHLAVKRTDPEMESVIRFLISQDVNINMPDCQGWTPFHAACDSGNLVACKLLIATGKANLIAATANRNFAHNLLVLNNYQACEIDTLKEVLKAIRNSYSKENCFNLRNLKGETCLHYLARNPNPCANDIGAIILDSGANPNLTNRRGYTPLHTAILQERRELVRLLICRGADTNIKCRDKNGADKSCADLLLMFPSMTSILQSLSAEMERKKGLRLSLNAATLPETSSSEDMTSPSLEYDNFQQTPPKENKAVSIAKIDPQTTLTPPPPPPPPPPLVQSAKYISF